MNSHTKRLLTKSKQPTSCYHCGLPVNDSRKYYVVINDSAQPMCCAGCQVVTQTIIDNDLSDYYQFRDPTTSKKPDSLILQKLEKNKVYDRPPIRSRYVKLISSQIDEITLMLEGLTCAACAWLIEKQLSKQVGIENIEVNYSNMTAIIKWNRSELELSKILTVIRQIGYVATPYEPRIQYQQLQKQHSQQLKRIGITAVLGMQIMIISVALYFGHFTGIDESWKDLLQKLGLLFTLPILFYGAQPFFKASLIQLKNVQPGMDVPVCLGLSLAFIASIWTIISGKGEVYFDSITMFVLLLLVARYFMHSSLLTASHGIERLATNTPLSASRLIQHSISSMAESVTADELKPGDWIRVLAGYVLPADGVVVNGSSSVNQAVISGESRAITVSENAKVIAGSINIDSPLIVKVTASGENTVFSAIEKMTKQSLSAQSIDSSLIDFIARWFVVGVLTIASAVAIYWWNTAPDQWLSVTIAVLVISCPCALSLSVPTAYATTNSKIMSQGLLLTKTAALENLTKTTHVVLDKTGTLTSETLQLESIKTFENLNQKQALRIAASMEVNSDHVLAKAILNKNEKPLYQAANWKNHIGLGISAEIESERYYLGSVEFLKEKANLKFDLSPTTSTVYLANKTSLLGEFHFSHSLRDGVFDLLDYFKNLNKPILMVTGDSQGPAIELAKQLGIKQVHSDCKPEDKLKIVKDLQEQGSNVLMIGDGINDSPVLAAADTSIAVSGATPLAVSGADIVMVNPSLSAINDLYQSALKTKNIIRQNISWSIGYNLLAIPFAASGMINPLFAAIGMSASSIIVVLNAQRLRQA